MPDIVLGSPKSAGAKTIPNPKGITPKADTDKPDLPEHDFMPRKSAITNPPTSSLLPKHPVEDLFTMHGIRHPLGHSVPVNHPSIKPPVVSEN